MFPIKFSQGSGIVNNINKTKFPCVHLVGIYARTVKELSISGTCIALEWEINVSNNGQWCRKILLCRRAEANVYNVVQLGTTFCTQ